MPKAVAAIAIDSSKLLLAEVDEEALFKFSPS
jgi:hypothetical protein